MDAQYWDTKYPRAFSLLIHAVTDGDFNKVAKLLEDDQKLVRKTRNTTAGVAVDDLRPRYLQVDVHDEYGDTPLHVRYDAAS